MTSKKRLKNSDVSTVDRVSQRQRIDLYKNYEKSREMSCFTLHFKLNYFTGTAGVNILTSTIERAKFTPSLSADEKVGSRQTKLGVSHLVEIHFIQLFAVK